MQRLVLWSMLSILENLLCTNEKSIFSVHNMKGPVEYQFVSLFFIVWVKSVDSLLNFSFGDVPIYVTVVLRPLAIVLVYIFPFRFVNSCFMQLYVYYHYFVLEDGSLYYYAVSIFISFNVLLNLKSILYNIEWLPQLSFFFFPSLWHILFYYFTFLASMYVSFWAISFVGNR